MFDPIYLAQMAAAATIDNAELNGIGIFDREKLEAHLAAYVVGLEVFHWYSHQDLERTNSGYLAARREFGIVYIPFHMARFFPFAYTLDELIELSNRVRVSESGYICLSGSTAIMGAVGTIGDIDFCEYSELFSDSDFQNLRSVSDRDSPDLVCTRMKWNAAMSVVRPWRGRDELIATSIQETIRDRSFETAEWKLDFVGLPEPFGPLAVTNKILPQKTGLDSVVVDARSWLFQEAIISTEDVPNVSLIQLRVFGSYLNWLRREVDTYLGKNAIKAAKRALSLSLIMGLDEFNALSLALKQTHLKNYIHHIAVQEAIRVRNFAEDSVPDEIQKALEVNQERVQADFEGGEIAAALEFCAQAAQAACDTFDDLFELAMMRLADATHE